ncbi:hypothetical protein F5880DRAFT_1554000 [Lentinula raphanica]|nr:hypothetical protein F5880DRAFT_1554000 [Lentinula raphanica]
MFRYQPTYFSSLPTDLGYPRPQYSRPRYLSPFTEQLRAADAQREEEELLRRLEEIQLQKQQQERLRRRFPYDNYAPYHSSYFEDDELERSAFRRRQQELELDYLRRKQEEEARILALKRAEEELKLQQLAKLREEEEARVAALRRAAEQVNAARPSRSRKDHSCCDNSDELCQLFGPQCQQQVGRQNISEFPVMLNDLLQKRHNNVQSEQPAFERLVSDLVQQLHYPQREREQTPKPVQEVPKRKTPSPSPVPRESVASPQTLEEVLRLMFDPQPHHTSHPVSEKASTPSKPVPQEKPRSEETVASRPVSKSSEAHPVSPLSLKEQLEARLNNDRSNEIKDTIQAILSSLSSNPSASSASPAPAVVSEVSVTKSNKGKEKAPEPQPTSAPTPGNAHKALEAVRAIEASLIALQDDFEFPSDVDFSPAPSRSSSPVRDDVSFVSETDTPTLRKLAYTARNHPIRSYEQALSRLLARLDEIESHGNAEVRNSRKAVVARVEGALEELEQKVEARWNKWSKSHRVDREEEVVEESEKKEEISEVSSSSEGQVQVEDSPQDDGTATVQVEVSPATESVSVVAIEPASVPPSSERVSYAEVVKQPDEEPASLPESSSTSESNVSSPSIDISQHLESSSDASLQGEEELVVSATEPSTIEPSSPTEDAEKPTSDSLPDDSEALPLSPSQPQASETTYPPVSSDSALSVETVRPLEIPSTPEDKPESDDHKGLTSIAGDESETEVVVDTFLLPQDTVADDQQQHLKKSERDSEDVGSDWSEVDA